MSRDRKQLNRKEPVKGHINHRGKLKRVVVGFDPQTFDELSAMAFEAKISMGQQIRILTERGIIASEDFEA